LRLCAKLEKIGQSTAELLPKTIFSYMAYVRHFDFKIWILVKLFWW